MGKFHPKVKESLQEIICLAQSIPPGKNPGGALYIPYFYVRMFDLIISSSRALKIDSGTRQAGTVAVKQKDRTFIMECLLKSGRGKGLEDYAQRLEYMWLQIDDITQIDIDQ